VAIYINKRKIGKAGKGRSPFFLLPPPFKGGDRGWVKNDLTVICFKKNLRIKKRDR